MKVLVTGATGYIGGRLVPRLLSEGHEVRCITRDPSRLMLDPWVDRVEVVAADLLDRDTFDAAIAGCDAAYYLIHAMENQRESFAELDRRAAENFADASGRLGIKRVIYLGGLGSDIEALSPHLASRQEVGQILTAGATPVTELRAAVIIGSGSVSFEMIRHLTEVLPVMMRPGWMRTKCQPIAVRNVLEILVSVLNDTENVDRVYDIGGPDVLTYEDMLQGYAEVAGLRKRTVLPMSIFSARLSPYFVGLFTPLPVNIARHLIESLRYDVIAHNEAPPGFEPTQLLSYDQALERALMRISASEVETRWSDALMTPAAPLPGDPAWSGERMEVDLRTVASKAPVKDMFWAFSRIGGDVGYYTLNWTWSLRGWFDQLIGGVGLRRGRRHPEELRPGEVVDFFRVDEVDREAGRLLLRGEMKAPGTAWLGWQVEANAEGSRLTQSARFAPRGLPGRLYWLLLLPIHAAIFRRMARKIVEAAEHRPRS